MSLAGNERQTEVVIDDREIDRLNATHEHAAKDKAMDLGKIGVFFGSRENASLYLAAMTVLFCGLIAAAFAYVEPTLRPDVEKAFIYIAVAAAGFMFGVSKGRGDG